MGVLGYSAAAVVMGVFALLASGSIMGTAVGAALGFALGFLVLPVLGPEFFGLPILAVLGVCLGLLFRVERDGSLRGALLALLVAVSWAVVVPFATSAPLLHAGAYRALLGPVDTVRNTPELAPMDPTRLRVVDGDLAERLAERVLGEKGALGSQVSIGTMDLQIVRDEWYWVAPLNHSGFFRWFANSEGTPGYVMVSAVDSRDVRLVTDIAGKPLRLRYNAGAFLGDDPARYLYGSGYLMRGLTDYSFEIDDTGRPYIVATEYEKRIGFGGAEAIGAVLLDAQTGEHRRCAIAECPAWVDLIQPEDQTVEQINDWGAYVHGWWNPSGREKLTSTSGITRIRSRDGRQYHYTGITSVNSDKGTTGYMLVDVRTGKATYYLQPGATEDAAMTSAQGSVQEKGYVAVFPTPYVVNGTWTYFVPLKDDARIVKAVAFVSASNDQVLGIGDTPEAALRKYRVALAAGGRSVADDRAQQTVVRGRVERLGVDVRQGDTYYYVALDGTDSLAFIGASAVSPKLPLTREGDVVEIRYEDTGRGVVDIIGFENPGLPLRRSAPEAAAAAEDSSRAATKGVTPAGPGTTADGGPVGGS